ncbi:MAG: aldolase/citrate lyase family protein [Actinobacteria bacterium]|nr:aldolase/citrate lyase family protein [Actinomycetota bacterium]MCL5026461.1 aldolase/citrate lyase family protein [Chloroflexota bacterium]
MPRVNKAIELLEQDQPVYLNIHYDIPEDHPFEAGVELARSWADLIDVDMERRPFDVRLLAAFMRGLRAGGPTASGHPTPAVYVTLPIDGSSEAVIRANSWLIWQVLDTGVHGLMLCGAEDPGAVRAYVEAARYPFNRTGVGNGLGEGRRGRSGYDIAAGIWDIPQDEYIYQADIWPLNPQGEIMLGLKLENKRALENAQVVASIPGIAFAEWGPGDMSWSLGLERAPRDPLPPQLAQARERIFAACRANNVVFLEGIKPEELCPMIDAGVRIFCGRGIQQVMEAGRAYTKRMMP